MQDQLYILIVVDSSPSPDMPSKYRHEYTEECIHDLLRKTLDRDFPPNETLLFVRWSTADGVRVHRMDSFSPYTDWFSTGCNGRERQSAKTIAIAAVMNYFTDRDARMITNVRSGQY